MVDLIASSLTMTTDLLVDLLERVLMPMTQTLQPISLQAQENRAFLHLEETTHLDKFKLRNQSKI